MSWYTYNNTGKTPSSINYLDIQLRDMDYKGVYGNISDKFLYKKDDNKYTQKDGEEEKSIDYEAPFIKAFNDAREILTGNFSSGKVRYDSIEKILYPIFEKRVEREQAFIESWVQLYKDNEVLQKNITIPKLVLKGKFPSEATLKKYANDFSKFIKIITGESNGLDAQDRKIINALRDPNFCDSAAGEYSKIFSRRAATRKELEDEAGLGKINGQDAINKYYEDLFNTFFFGGTVLNSKLGRIVYTTNSIKKVFLSGNKKEIKALQKTNPSEIFKRNFYNFIEKYYKDLIEKNSDFEEKLMDLKFDAIERIFSNLSRIKTEKIILKNDLTGKGVSHDNEMILKSMMEQTFREIAGSPNLYKNYEIEGLIELSEDWRKSPQGFHQTLQVRINDATAKFRNKKGTWYDQQGNLGGTSDYRYSNWSWNVDRDKDKSQNRIGKTISENTYYANAGTDYERPLVQEFLNFLTNKMGQIDEEHKDKLRKAVFGMTGGGTARGLHVLKLMSAPSPGHFRGMCGEIAMAYILRSVKVKTAITGSEMSSSGTGQVHYDVVARLLNEGGVKNIGFQVKNYNINMSKKALYTTSDSLSSDKMKRYMPESDLKKYRWIVANGTFITTKNTSPKFQSKRSLIDNLEKSLIRYTDAFLRINDAGDDINNSINSDIFVIGDKYYPSSFLIGKAYYKQKDNSQKNLFTFSGNFPNYSKKVAFTGRSYKQVKRKRGGITETKRLKFWTVDSSGKRTSENLVNIERNKENLLKNVVISFNGLTFTI